MKPPLPGDAVRATMRAILVMRGEGWTDVAFRIGVSAATLTRIMRSETFDEATIETLARGVVVTGGVPGFCRAVEAVSRAIERAQR